MNKDRCAVVRMFLHTVFVERRSAAPAPYLYTHLAGCDACRGVFALHLASAIGITAPPGPINCDDCDQDMAALIEIERDAGTIAARTAYPDLWWHLWTCRDCAETYRLTRLLLRSEQLPRSEPPRRQPLITFSREFMAGTIDYTYVTTARRGKPGVPIVISSPEPGDNPQLSFSIQRQQNGEWTLHVTVLPAPMAWLVVRIGAFEARARFGEAGQAQIPAVPAELLLASDAPDLEFSLDYAA